MNNYDDIINLEHPNSKKHIRMSIENRAAQFSPFAALTGYDLAVKEAGRKTYKQKELTNEEKIIISNKLNFINNQKIKTNVQITYFAKDKLKKGGSYQKVNGVIRKIDFINKKILINNQIIFIYDIIDIVSNDIE